MTARRTRAGLKLLRDREVLSLLAASVYDPTPEGLRARAERYFHMRGVRVLVRFSDGRPVGIAVLRLANREGELLDIAVREDARGQGHGRELLREALRRYALSSLVAETDDDAVGFYRRLGFSVTSLGEKYPGVTRYACVYIG